MGSSPTPGVTNAQRPIARLGEHVGPGCGPSQSGRGCVLSIDSAPCGHDQGSDEPDGPACDGGGNAELKHRKPGSRRVCEKFDGVHPDTLVALSEA